MIWKMKHLKYRSLFFSNKLQIITWQFRNDLRKETLQSSLLNTNYNYLKIFETIWKVKRCKIRFQKNLKDFLSTRKNQSFITFKNLFDFGTM